MGSRSVVPSRHLHSSQFTTATSSRVRVMRFGMLTIGAGTAFRRGEKSKTMKTKTNLKAGSAKGNVAAKWSVAQGAAA